VRFWALGFTPSLSVQSDLRDLCASPLTYKAENRFCSAAAESNERCMNAAVRATDIMSRRLCGLGSNHVAYPVS
jgi:hypothetical protein